MSEYKNFIFFHCLFLFILFFLGFEGEGKNIKLLIKTRLEIENVIMAGRKNKNVMWGQVLNIKEIDPEFSHYKEQITKKKF